MKKKFIDAHMKAAGVYAELSSAKRLKVGCVIVKDNTIIGIGYNGMPSGWTNECEDVEWSYDIRSTYFSKDWKYCEQKKQYYRTVTKPEVIHAESNAISKVARSTHSTQDADLFVTHAPCIQCAKLIHQSGIKSVFYHDRSRDELGLEFLKKCNIEVTKV
jgi:dCMP deaminase